MSTLPRLDRRVTTPWALVLAGSFACLLAGCGPSARITVANAAREALREGVIAGATRRHALTALSPGDSIAFDFALDDEDAVALRGRLGGHALTPMMAVVVEPGDALRFEVGADGVVRVARHTGGSSGE